MTGVGQVEGKVKRKKTMRNANGKKNKRKGMFNKMKGEGEPSEYNEPIARNAIARKETDQVKGKGAKHVKGKGEPK